MTGMAISVAKENTKLAPFILSILRARITTLRVSDDQCRGNPSRARYEDVPELRIAESGGVENLL